METEKRRKSLRLGYYDYSTPGACFITFCTQGRRNTLSRTVGAIHESPLPRLTDWGAQVEQVIRTIPSHLNVSIDRYVIMPNHVHLIILVSCGESTPPAGAGCSLISKAVGYIKMNASKAIRQRYGDVQVWQRGYHDHVIRNREDYEMIARYISENPIRWQVDKLYSEE